LIDFTAHIGDILFFIFRAYALSLYPLQEERSWGILPLLIPTTEEGNQDIRFPSIQSDGVVERINNHMVVYK